MENSKKTQSSTNEINVNDLLDNARRLIKENNKETSEYFINLALLAPDADFSLKIQTMAIRSFIHFTSQSEDIVLLVAKKFLKEIRRKDVAFDQDVCYCFIRALYRAGNLLLKSKNDIFLSAFFFHRAKVFLENNEVLQNNSESKNSIESNFIAVLDEISKKLQTKKENYIRDLELNNSGSDTNTSKSNGNFSSPSLNIIYEYFLQKYNTAGEEHDKVYLISSIWIRNMISFLNKRDGYVDKLFDRKNVCLLYFNDGRIKDEYKRFLGNYPGPVNNFHIVQLKDNWVDPLEGEEYTNVFLRSDVKENNDFIYLPEDIYHHIKRYFEVHNFEIERRLVRNEDKVDSNMYEIHLRKIKVLVLSNLFMEGGLHLIRTRYIQISKTKTIRDLKNKILRCIQHSMEKVHKGGSKVNGDYNSSNSYNANNFQFKLFTPDMSLQNKKKDLLSIIYSYINKFTSYKIKGEEINDDNLLIENLKLAVKDVLIIEIRGENDPRKNWFINIKVDKFPKCALCDKDIKEMKIFCELCDQNYYCSDVCRENDEVHKKYHINMNKLYKKKFELGDILSIDMNELVPQNSRRGLTGLKNLGNTCFMNSALQCLSNCEELTKYFLLRKFADEVNKKNKYGSGGQIAKAYYDLMRELWQGTSPYLSPWDFRQIFVGFVKQFAGFSQHDSHEMLAFMLDALHEDLNRVKEKPYFELKEKISHESEEEASQRWWDSHLARENSIIVDLFHGQYKSVITCPDCHRISITYDPFMYLGLPIAAGQCKAKVKFFPCEDWYKMLEFEVSVNEHTTLRDIKNKVKSDYTTLILSGNNNTYKGEIYLEAIVTSSKSFKKRIAESSPVISYYEHGNEIILYETELPVESRENITFYVLPIEFVEEKSLFGHKSKSALPLFYVKPFIFKKDMTVRDLYYQIFVYYRKIFPDMPNRLYEEFYTNRNDSDYTYDEFVKYFSNNPDLIPFKLHIINNIPEANSYSYSSTICEFCGRACDFCCQFNFNLDSTLEEVKDKQKVRRPFLLFAEITNLSKRRKLFENVDLSSCSRNVFSHKGEVNLYDCLEAFRSDEKLEKDNAWYCSVCKQHQEANKKLDIFRAPNILIIQLKRFKIKTNNVILGMMHNKKNDSLVQFPVEDLDLRPYIVCKDDRNDAIYELIAVSQHFGSLSSGHYTALCRNSQKWYHFDDERVSRSSEENVVTPAAYLLFYRKKSLKI